jgi:ATP-binding cassette subfamily F protein uup
MLARALAKPSNVLVLDEPTNDLDLETLDVLEEMLGNYAGTVILISHDRDFLDRVVNAVIVPDGDGDWVEYAGGYADMLAQRGADVRRTPKAKAAGNGKPAPPAAPPPSARRKLSFHEKHALDTLPKQIATLQADIRRLQARLDDPTLYTRDRDAFAKTSGTLAAAQSELATAEEKWLALEILREEIEEK